MAFPPPPFASERAPGALGGEGGRGKSHSVRLGSADFGECQCCLGRVRGCRLFRHPEVRAARRCAAAAPTAVIARLDRAIQYAEAIVDEPRSRSVLEAPVKPGHDSGAPSPNLAQLSHFATLFPVSLSFGTTLERIAAESLTPC